MTNEYTRAENHKKTRSWLILLGVIGFVALVALFKDMAENAPGSRLNRRRGSCRNCRQPVNLRWFTFIHPTAVHATR